jgi:hypothetical protein
MRDPRHDPRPGDIVIGRNGAKVEIMPSLPDDPVLTVRIRPMWGRRPGQLNDLGFYVQWAKTVVRTV